MMYESDPFFGDADADPRKQALLDMLRGRSPQSGLPQSMHQPGFRPPQARPTHEPVPQGVGLPLGSTALPRAGGASGSWGPPQAAPQAPQATPRPRAGPPLPAPPATPQGPPMGLPAPNALADLQAQQERMLIAGPDRSAMEEAYTRNQQEGGQGLLLALAAQEANMQPISAHYLKRAAAADQPMKTAGGTMTPTGFIPDADYKQANEMAVLGQKIQREQHIIDAATTQKDKLAAEERKQGYEMAQRRYTEGQANYRARLTASATGDKLTDTERSGAGYAHRMSQIEPTIRTLEKDGRPGFVTNLMGYDGVGGKLRPYAESEAQQKYRAAQEDWVRAKLRRESGAAIPEAEMEREIRTYFVQPGESEDVAAQKQVSREAAMQQMRIGAGRAANQIGGGDGPGGPPPGAVREKRR